MKTWPNIDQQQEIWRRVRAGRPTASNASRIITPGGKDAANWEGYAYELISECVRPDEIGIGGAAPAFSGNHDTDRGNELEPEAREAFAARMGFEARQIGFVTTDDEIAGCSPDAFCYRDGKLIAGLEIKCPRSKNHIPVMRADEMPKEHLPQVHFSMAVTELDYWYFMSYCPGWPDVIKRIEADDYTAKVRDALERFLIYYAEERAEILPMAAFNQKNQ